MRRLLTVVALAGLLASASPAFSAARAPTESYSTLRHQIDTGQVVLAYINQSTRDIRVTLKNGFEQRAVFPAAQHKVLVDSLFHHGVTPKFTTAAAKHAPKRAHHLLRYIAAGVVVVLLLAGGGVWIYTRDQRPPEDTARGTADAPNGAT